METKKRIDYTLILVSLVIVFGVVIYLGLYPEQSATVANNIFGKVTDVFTSPVLLFCLLNVIFLIWLAFSKYGNIKLGEGKPKYSTFTWVAMFVCAGMGAETGYWALLEWAYYYDAAPMLNGVVLTDAMRYEMALAYQQFHWGPAAWALYCVFALCVSYHFLVRKKEGLSVSAVVGQVIGEKWAKGLPGKIMDFIYIFSSIGAIGLALGLSMNMIAEGISAVTGLQNTFMLKVILILICTAIYSFSSVIGIEKGLSKLADRNTIAFLGFAVFILLVGPTIYTIDNFVNSLGITIQNYFRMSLWSDPYNVSQGFNKDWTVFFFLYWLTFAPFLGLFTTSVSKGRKIKEVIANMLISGCLGILFFNGILGSYAMHLNLTGEVNVVDLLTKVSGDKAIIEILNTLPLAAIAIAVFVIVAILFLATTLDSTASTLASVSIKGLKEGEQFSPMLRFFWCIMLSLVPLTMIFIDASLDTFKTLSIVTAVPMLILLIIMIYGFIKHMRQDFGLKTKDQIIEQMVENDKNMADSANV